MSVHLPNSYENIFAKSECLNPAANSFAHSTQPAIHPSVHPLRTKLFFVDPRSCRFRRWRQFCCTPAQSICPFAPLVIIIRAQPPPSSVSLSAAAASVCRRSLRAHGVGGSGPGMHSHPEQSVCASAGRQAGRQEDCVEIHNMYKRRASASAAGQPNPRT